jgi:hypothetical protein
LTDDNARALIVAVMLYERDREKIYEELIYRFLSFLLGAQNKDGRFGRHMTFDRKYSEGESSEETYGRCLWSLGYTMGAPHVSSGIKKACSHMFKRALPELASLEEPKSRAFAIIGLSFVVREMSLQKEIEFLADSMVREFKLYSYDGWDWFGDILTYGNAVLPWSLFRAYKILRNPDYLKIALDSLDFLRGITLHVGYYKAIGSNGWISRGQQPAAFDEKPVDVAKTALAYLEAFYLFKEIKYLETAKLCLSWFDGHNSKKLIMVDQETGACYDAITAEGINQDQGAEGLLSYCMAFLSLYKFLNQE